MSKAKGLNEQQDVMYEPEYASMTSTTKDASTRLASPKSVMTTGDLSKKKYFCIQEA